MSTFTHLFEVFRSAWNPDTQSWAEKATFALLLPSLVLLWSLIKHRRCWTGTLVATVLGCGLTSLLGARWVESGGGLGLYLPPVFIGVVLGLSYTGRFLPQSVAYGACFVSLLLTDLTSAWLRFGSTNGDFSWLQGIGGAGALDGLFGFPLACVVLQAYARWRTPTAKTSSL